MNAPGKSEFWTSVFLSVLSGAAAAPDSGSNEEILGTAYALAEEAESMLQAAVAKALAEKAAARDAARSAVLDAAKPGRVYTQGRKRYVVDHADATTIYFVGGSLIAWNEIGDCCIEPTDEYTTVEEEQQKHTRVLASFKPGKRYLVEDTSGWSRERTVDRVDALHVYFDDGGRVHVTDLLAGEAQPVSDAA